MLTRDAIFSATDRKHKTVNVPEWGGDVRIDVMSGADRDEFDAWLMDNRKGDTFNTKKMKVFLLCMTVAGEDGKKLFTLADLDALNEKNGEVINKLFEVAQDINGMSQKSVERLEKN